MADEILEIIPQPNGSVVVWKEEGTRSAHFTFIPNKPATPKPVDYPEPEHKGNTMGVIVPKTSPLATAPNKAPETPEEKNFLEWYASDYLDSVRQGLDDWVASTGYSQPAMITGAILTGITKMVGAVMPTSGEEVVMMPLGVEVKGAGKALKWLEDALKFKKEEEKARKAAEEAAKLKRAKEEAQAANSNRGGHVKGQAGPCDHLKQGSGTGPYRGGAHSKTSKPANDGKDSHHMPADSASPLAKKDGPAIQMDPKDHGRTSSNGQMEGWVEYIESIRDLIDNGKWDEAMIKEIKDTRRVAKEAGDPRRYNEAMLEMLEYYKCLKMNGLLK